MIIKKSMKSNIVLNCLKTALSFIFPLITFPYVSRILGTVGLGKVNFSNSIISYFALISSLGVLNYSIREGSALRNSEKERNKFFNEVFTVNFISMIVSYLLLLIVALVSAKLKDYYLLLAIQSLTMLFSWLGVEWIYNIYEDYFLITIRSFVAQLLSLALMFLLVKTPEDYVKYALITVIANGGAYIFNYLYAGRYYRPKLTLHCEFKKHFLPMLILAANTIAITIYVNSDTTMIGYFLDDHHVGLYSTAVKVYNIVKHVMAAIIASGTPRVSFYYHNGDIERYQSIMTKMAKVLLLVSLPAMVGVFMTSNDIILVLAGKGYSESTPALRLLAFAIAFATFGSYCATYGLVVQRKEKTLLKHTTISALINVCLNFFMIPWLGIIGAAITTVISELYVFITFCAITKFAVIAKDCKKTVISSVFSCCAIILVCFAMRGISSLLMRLVLSVGLSVAVYGVILVLRKEDVVMSVLKRKNI